MIEFELAIGKVSPAPTSGGADGGIVVEAGARAADTLSVSPAPAAPVDEANVDVKVSYIRLRRIAPHATIVYKLGVPLMLLRLTRRRVAVLTTILLWLILEQREGIRMDCLREIVETRLHPKSGNT